MKSIKIIYEDFIEANGKVEKTLKTATIQFSEKTVEYKPTEGYVENFENMVYEILQNGFAYINETEVITILNIKKFVGNNDSPASYTTQNNQAAQTNQNQNRMPQGQKKWRKHSRRPRIQETLEPSKELSKEPVKEVKEVKEAKEESQIPSSVEPVKEETKI